MELPEMKVEPVTLEGTGVRLEPLDEELHRDMRNTKSRAAIARIGGVFEGTLRAHMVMRDGHIRDTAVFSITRPEWPEVRDALAARVAGQASTG